MSLWNPLSWLYHFISISTSLFSFPLPSLSRSLRLAFGKVGCGRLNIRGRDLLRINIKYKRAWCNHRINIPKCFPMYEDLNWIFLNIIRWSGGKFFTKLTCLRSLCSFYIYHIDTDTSVWDFIVCIFNFLEVF